MCNNYLQVILHHYRSNASTLAPLTHFTSIDLVMMTFPITHSSSGIAAEIISTFQNLLWKRLGKFYFYNTMFNSDPCKSDIYICSFGDTSTAPYLTPGYRSCSLAIQIPDQYHIPHTHMHSSDCCPFSHSHSQSCLQAPHFHAENISDSTAIMRVWHQLK